MLDRFCARLVGSALLLVVGACAHDAVAPSLPDALIASRPSANLIQPLPDGELVSLTFYINHGVCGGPVNFSFSINDVTLAPSQPLTLSGCTCNSDEPSVTLSGPEARAAWNARKGAANVIAVRTTGSNVYVGYIRLVVATVNGSATVPLFDASGGSAEQRGLCNALVLNRPLFEKRFGPPFTLPVGDLLSITFFINHNDCELMTGEFTFTMNGVPLGSSRTTVGCSCNTDELQVKFDSPETRAAWLRGGDNTISVHLNDKVVLVAYI